MGGRTKSTWYRPLAGEDKARKNERSRFYCAHTKYTCFITCPILQLAATLDLLPTMVTLAGAEMPKVTLDGSDMAPILLNNEKVITIIKMISH